MIVRALLAPPIPRSSHQPATAPPNGGCRAASACEFASVSDSEIIIRRPLFSLPSPRHLRHRWRKTKCHFPRFYCRSAEVSEQFLMCGISLLLKSETKSVETTFTQSMVFRPTPHAPHLLDPILHSRTSFAAVGSRRRNDSRNSRAPTAEIP
jgi:hypothetical protein